MWFANCFSLFFSLICYIVLSPIYFYLSILEKFIICIWLGFITLDNGKLLGFTVFLVEISLKGFVAHALKFAQYRAAR